ncbi:tetratricopeptide repeat protein [Legionella londiniensis]|uniref:Tetratricopeptide repeat protein n=1 Tax=Legionella londiniensis TaxID=45068 RepID=A0A0W0VNW7_9GAMM|nr:tetratricopeptide repeat protein [Legionella londiniensis]KTD21828.1 Tetratricopeptide repeat protein [Legionella londiniensis]STX92689.1 Predicted O-linked N-acetylglucosamine transferase, SPINDLY family [Legionella londiniensis]
MTSQSETAKKYLYAGHEYYQQGEYQLAENQYSLAIDEDPNHAEAYYKRAFCRIWQKKFSGVKEDENQLIQLKSEYINNLRQLSIAYLAALAARLSNNYMAAEQHLTTILGLDPDNVGSIANRAGCRLAQKNFTGFEEDCMRVINLNCQNSLYQNALNMLSQSCTYLPESLQCTKIKIMALIHFKLNQPSEEKTIKRLLSVVNDSKAVAKDAVDIFAFFLKHGLMQAAKQVMHTLEVKKDAFFSQDPEQQARFANLKDHYSRFTFKSPLYQQQEKRHYTDICIIAEKTQFVKLS